MKQLWQKVCSYFGGVPFWVLTLYTTVMLVLQPFQSGLHSVAYIAVTGLIVLILSALLWPVLLRFFSKLHICPRVQKDQESVLHKIGVNCPFYLIPLAVFLLYFIAYYPGGFSFDSMEQYIQTLSNQYNDWHPVLHTLLTFKLPLLLTGGWIGSVVLLQSLCWCGVIGYACQVIRKHFGIWPAVITMAYILINPLMMLTSMHPWKDVGFAICALLLGTYALQAVVTKGAWLQKPLNMVCFAVAVVVTTIVRHNGILFTAPVIVAMLLFLSWKRGLTLCLGIVLLFGMVKGPIYGLFKVEDPGLRQVETLGLPMTIICTVAHECPEQLDDQTKEFISRFSPPEAWEESFEFGNFNSIKHDSRTNIALIEEYGAKEILSMMLRCIKASPTTALRSVLMLTGQTYYLRGASTGYIEPNVMKTPYIQQENYAPLRNFFSDYADVIANYFSSIFMCLGIAHLILLILILLKCNLKKRQGWSKLLIGIAIFSYNFGTALLLSSSGDIFRFFFYTFPLMPVVILLLLCDHKERSKPLFAWLKKCKKF